LKSAPVTVRLRNIPLNLRVSNDIEITNSPVQEVNLEVAGDKRKIEQLNLRDLVVSLDLTDVQAGERWVQIAPENVLLELPTGIRLEEIQPNRIAVKLEAVAEREVTVRAETEGALPENFEIYSRTVSPAKVRVRGPESFIKSLDFVSTEKISVENRRENFAVRQVALNIANPKVTLLDPAVDVDFVIGENRIERMFTVAAKTDAGNKTASVVLYGGRSILESLKPEDLRVEVVKNETGEMFPNLILPVEFQGQVEVRKIKIN
jgi:YbbR domain-containing protein